MAHHEAVSSFSGDASAATCTLTSEAAPGVTFHRERQHPFKEVPVSFRPNCRCTMRSLVKEGNRSWVLWGRKGGGWVWGGGDGGVAVTFPSHPNGPVNRACECTPLRYWRTNSPPFHFPPAFFRAPLPFSCLPPPPSPHHSPLASFSLIHLYSVMFFAGVENN